MPRPSVEEKVRLAVREYLVDAVKRSRSEAPLNVFAVAESTGFNRKTLKKYGLDVEIAVAAKNQAKGGKISAREAQQHSHADALRTRDQEISELRHRCEELVARICLAEGNAQRIGIDPVELWKPLAAPDRSIPHPGGKWNNRRRESCENSQR